MGFAIVLSFDEELAGSVRRIWGELEAGGVGVSLATFDEPPHVSLALIPDADREYLVSLVDSLTLTGLAVRLVPFGVFLGERCTLYCAAALDPGLLVTYAELYGRLRDDSVDYDPLSAPGSVVFHCTLAVDVGPRLLSGGAEVCRRFPDTLVGRVEAVELLEYFPVRGIHRRDLGNRSSRQPAE
jgi:hypothetical protein